MLYQKMITGETPYHVTAGRISPFTEHRHADIELHYCLSGTLDIQIDKSQYRLCEGDLALVLPMVSHGIPRPSVGENRILMAILGPSFLKKQFGHFSKIHFRSPVLSLSDPAVPPEAARELRALFSETADLSNQGEAHADLLLTGNLYKICAYLLRIFAFGDGSDGSDEPTDPAENARAPRDIANVEKALELIYYRYPEPITVEDAAKVTGYGKSNFCKIFRRTVGTTFHSLLNRQRVESACALLSETDFPVSEIAVQVGFGESKTLCRVFRSLLGVSPGEYRRAYLSGEGSGTDAPQTETV